MKITAIIPAYKRLDALLNTLANLKGCFPLPDEILVHVDGNQLQMAEAVQKAHPDVRVLTSSENIGPGGGRNKLIAAAQYPVVVSFDDDSFPMETDFFARVDRVFSDVPEASVVACDITERNAEAPRFSAERPMWVASFVGCGCAYRRDDFLKLQGYVPLPNAYGCEEVDLMLQLLDAGMNVLYHPDLRVYHDTTMEHHASTAVNAASIRNIALLVFLRYPIRYWLLGFFQVFNRVRYLLRMKRFSGIASGVLGIIPHCLRFRRSRRAVDPASFRSFRHVQRTPLEVMP